MQYLSFPGIGIDWFHIDKSAFTIFGRGIAWYGILITLGMILAVIIAIKIGKIEGIKSDTILDLAIFIVIFGVIGARAYYVIFTWNEGGYLVTDGSFWHNVGQTIYNCIATWEGGMAIHGGIIAGMITAVIFAKKKKIYLFKLFDLLVPCVLIGQVIGRWGNFINVEVYGRETESFLRMGIGHMSPSGEIVADMFVHPTFLYESLWNLLALVLILIFYKKKKFHGVFFSFYLIWYGVGRTFLESLRVPEFNLMIGPFRLSMIVGILMAVAGIVVFAILYSRYKAKKLAGEEYTDIFGAEDVKTEDKETEKIPEKSESSPEETKSESKDDNTGADDPSKEESIPENDEKESE